MNWVLCLLLINYFYLILIPCFVTDIQLFPWKFHRPIYNSKYKVKVICYIPISTNDERILILIPLSLLEKMGPAMQQTFQLRIFASYLEVRKLKAVIIILFLLNKAIPLSISIYLHINGLNRHYTFFRSTSSSRNPKGKKKINKIRKKFQTSWGWAVPSSAQLKLATISSKLSYPITRSVYSAKANCG